MAKKHFLPLKRWIIILWNGPSWLGCSHGKQASLQISREMPNMINKSSKIKTLVVVSPARNPNFFPYCCHKALFFRIPKGNYTALFFFLTLLVFPLSFLSFISSFHPSGIFCCFSILLFCANRRELLSSSGRNFNLRVNITNCSKGTSPFHGKHT